MSSRLQGPLAQGAIAQQGGAPSPFPQQMPGMPDAVQGFPQDMGALQQLMAKGFSPGSGDAEARMGMQAASMARAIEERAVRESFEQDQDDEELLQLGSLLSSIMARRGGGGGAQAAAPLAP
jgi:hypothetical protein